MVVVGRARAAPRSPLFVAAVVMAIGFLLGVTDPAAGLTQQASVGIFDDDGGRALFPNLTMAPGHRYAQCILVGAGSATDQDAVRFSAADVAGDLASHLGVEVETGTGGRFGDCSGFAGSSIFSGTLTDLAAVGQGDGLVTGWSPAQATSRAFRITVSLDPRFAQQGLVARGRFVWHLAGAGAPTSPTSATPTTPTPPVPPPASSPSGTRPAAEPGAGVPAEPPRATTTEPQARDAATEPLQVGGAPVRLTPPTGPLPPELEPDVSIGQGLARLVDLAIRAQRAAVAMVAEPQYPVTALLLALGFLLVQDQIDRRDPKLIAVARTRDNEQGFPDRFGIVGGR